MGNIAGELRRAALRVSERGCSVNIGKAGV